jgi:hypothetical protein
MDLFSGLSAVYSETFLSSGSMRNGSVYARPTPAPRTAGSASSSSPGLLPTPTVSDANGAGEHGDGGTDLRTAVSLLPAPNSSDSQGGPRAVPERRTSGGPDHGPRLRDVAPLLPTPRATDGTNGGPNQRGSSGDLMLPSAVMLLPTPTATDGKGPGPLFRQRDGKARPPADDDLPTAVVRSLLPTSTAMDSKASGGSTASDVTLTDAVVLTDLGRTANPRLLPTPRAAADRTSRSAATRQDSRSAPSLGQAVEIAQGLLPREFTSWEELPPSWRHGQQLSIEGD